MPEIKLCKECRWAVNLTREADAPALYWECHHPSSVIIGSPDLVTGKPPKKEWEFCSSARTFKTKTSTGESLCGPDGNFWEPALSDVVGFGSPEGERFGLDDAGALE